MAGEVAPEAAVVVAVGAAGELMQAREDRPGATVRGRTWAYGFSIAVIIAILSPVFGDPRADSFPLSTYPMFSGRQSSEVEITHVVGFTADGDRVTLAPEALGTDEVVQAFETSRQAVARGQTESQDLCEDAAEWGSSHRQEAVSFALVTDSFDAIEYFDGDDSPRATTVHAECEARE